MASDLQGFANLKGEDRMAKIEEVFRTSGTETDMSPLYDAWASKYDQVCANILVMVSSEN